MTCGQWKSQAVGAYAGNFQAKTKNPILFATNRYDGHTPIRSAQNVSAGFEGSGMLVVNGFGHTTLAQQSVCTIQQTVAYWHNRTLPAKGFVCEVDAAPYGDYAWANATLAYDRKANNSGPGGSGAPPPPRSAASQTSQSLAMVLFAIGIVFAFGLQ
ncbi:hypothetical protein JDV02_003465 [Purpureocillium takamizusanense]|uniref:Peptidase S33 tripeptidyl aminopeptidase-like C-terminal domain-containing protein n=1 Tax=Purpureocillium takamizusanense TaxID=2060973 RepID=A0A9Q8V9S6_9HYPO|nr:uncharacterized protein JDV02_003465 [Purpureocillium takamizusanense]UNI17087.1 hypothetical protein JDV02_003465 [Purpureocillium takamizusanense]